MKSFLLKGKSPTIKWGSIPHGYFFEGSVPEGYGLAVCPSEGYVILDIDRHGDIDGFKNVPFYIRYLLKNHFQYNTKNNGKHIWLKYTGNVALSNKASGLGIDLRTHKGYAKWYLTSDIRDCIGDIKPTCSLLNAWLEKLFSYVGDDRKAYKHFSFKIARLVFLYFLYKISSNLRPIKH